MKPQLFRKPNDSIQRDINNIVFIYVIIFNIRLFQIIIIVKQLLLLFELDIIIFLIHIQ